MSERWWKGIVLCTMLMAALLAGYTLVQQINQAHGQTAAYPDLNTDLHTYQLAAGRWQNQDPLYAAGHWVEGPNFRYHPVFAVIFGVMSRVLPPDLFLVTWFLKNILVYLGAGLLFYLYVIKEILPKDWQRRFKLVFFPLLLVNVAWLINSLGFGNINGDLFLLTTLAMIAILRKQSLAAGVLLALILLVKPQWVLFIGSFALLSEPFSSSLRIIGSTIASYLGINAIYSFTSGQYGLQMLSDYFSFITHAVQNFNWEAAVNKPDPYNQSIQYLLTRWFGHQPINATYTVLIQACLVAVAAFIGFNVRKMQTTPINRRLIGLLFAYCVAYPVSMLLLFEINEMYLAMIGIALICSTGSKAVRVLLVFPFAYVLSAFAEMAGLVVKPDITTLIPFAFLAAVFILLAGMVVVIQLQRGEQREAVLTPNTASF